MKVNMRKFATVTTSEFKNKLTVRVGAEVILESVLDDNHPLSAWVEKLSCYEILQIIKINQTLSDHGHQPMTDQEIKKHFDPFGYRWLETTTDDLTKLAGYTIKRSVVPYPPKKDENDAD